MICDLNGLDSNDSLDLAFEFVVVVWDADNVDKVSFDPFAYVHSQHVVLVGLFDVALQLLVHKLDRPVYFAELAVDLDTLDVHFVHNVVVVFSVELV